MAFASNVFASLPGIHAVTIGRIEAFVARTPVAGDGVMASAARIRALFR